MPRKRLVLFVEGQGDAEGAPILVKRLFTELNSWDAIELDPNPFNLKGGIHRITGEKHRDEWTKKLEAAKKRPNLGAVLLLLDGDMRKKVEGKPFDPLVVAQLLVERARPVGAGAVFSLACIFARQEFESWLLAGIPSLAGKLLSDKRHGVRAGAVSPEGDLELQPRDAKAVLGRLMEHGYKPALDQGPLTELVDLNEIRRRNLKSFGEFEQALRELAEAFRAGQHIVVPS